MAQDEGRQETGGAALSGHCLCGDVTITVSGGHDPRPGACHCRMCQRWSGGLFVVFPAPAEAVRVEGEVARYASSSRAERAFCRRCGSHLWWRETTEGAGYDLMPGLFDAAADWPLHSEIYSDRALASVRLEGDHRRATRAEWEAKNPHFEGEA
ncbi:MAG: GFA family protein [Tranquillimonas sp.]